tara:strand:- start:515 stop:760 length:246 start_codon:yes stop_codon:yes gene_type:complete
MENNTKKEICDMLNISEYMNDMYLEIIENVNHKLKLEINLSEDINNDLSGFWNKICELENELNILRGNENYNNAIMNNTID